MKINIGEIIERMDMLIDEWLYFLDIRTGEIYEMEERYFRIAEEIEDDEIDRYSNWEKECIQAVIKFYDEGEYFIELPSKYDIHEYSIMDNFIYSLTNQNHISSLKAAIHGKGAFRKFKDTINYLGIEQKWYDFKQKVLKDIAVKWCEENELEY